MRLDRLGLTFAAGIAIVASGCSSPVPPTPDGGYQVTFISNGCSIAGHQGSVGDVNATERNVVVDDGADGASVSCSVTGAGPFAVTGQIQLGGNALQIAIPSLPTTATATMPAPGHVAFTSPNTVNTYSAAGMVECNFYFVAGSKESVAPGKAWVAFTCPAISYDGSGTMDTCELNESYMLLENCSQ